MTRDTWMMLWGFLIGWLMGPRISREWRIMVARVRYAWKTGEELPREEWPR